MGAGLKIDRAFDWSCWSSTWRLLGIALLGCGLLGLPVGAAVLLAGILAPTDPVPASAVQVGPPGSGEEDEIRFALASDAGLNDGLAFPFVSLLAPLTWTDGAFAVLTLFVVRPLATLAGFLGSSQPLLTRLAAGYFGIRGLGSFYYVMFAENHGRLEHSEHLWAVVGLVVSTSVVVYGVSANPVMRRVDARCRVRPQRQLGHGRREGDAARAGMEGTG